MSTQLVVTSGAMLLAVAFFMSFIFPPDDIAKHVCGDDRIPAPPEPTWQVTIPRLSGNSHQRRLARRAIQRAYSLAADQTPVRGARGPWRRTHAGESLARSISERRAA